MATARFEGYRQALAYAEARVEEELARHGFLIEDYRAGGFEAKIAPTPVGEPEFESSAYAAQLAGAREAHATE